MNDYIDREAVGKRFHKLILAFYSLLGESGNDLQDRYVHQLIDDLARAFVWKEGEKQ